MIFSINNIMTVSNHQPEPSSLLCWNFEEDPFFGYPIKCSSSGLAVSSEVLLDSFVLGEGDVGNFS